jgi:predicted dehydrogenase
VSGPVRIGVVGCGSVMQRAYMPQIERLRARGLAEVVAACDVADARLAEVRRGFGVERLTTDYREVVEAADVDLVLVLTSMPSHGPIARAALEAGKHVLVEKPMAVTLEEADQIVALAARSPGYLLCAPHVILSPTFRAIGQHLRNGDVGRVLTARARYGWSGPDWGAWFYQPGGGPLFDLGVYNVTTLTGWLGPARRVTAMAGTAIPERTVDGRPTRVEVEDNVQLLLDFGGATFAVVTTGFTMQRYRSPAIELYGSEGTIQMLGDDWAPQGYELWRNDRGHWEVHEETSRQWSWTDGLRHLVECIDARTRPAIRPEHARHVLEIMLRALESARDGRARELTSTFAPVSFADPAETVAAHRAHDPSHGN